MAADIFAGLRVDGARANAEGMTVIGRPRRWAALRGRDTAPRTAKAQPDQAAKWLQCAMFALAALAIAAAVVSFQAQYSMVLTYKGIRAIAALQAGIPDAGAAVFASLGIALALQGKRAIRARLLNVACVAVSIFMNALASAPGWRGLAVWIMAPVIYAVASDTLINVIRQLAIARAGGADDGATPLAILAGAAFWCLRLALAPKSTVAGFRGWVIDAAPVAPGRTASGELTAPAKVRAITSGRRREGTKTARLLQLVTERCGSLAAVPLDQVSPLCAELAPVAGLDAGAARSALRKAVLAARPDGDAA